MSFQSLIFPIVKMIPEELIPRDFSSSKALGSGLFVCFTLLAVSKLMKTNIFETLLVSSIKIKGVESFVKTKLPLNKNESYALLINYILAFSLLLFILLGSPTILEAKKWAVILTLPIIFATISILGLFFVIAISGESKMLIQIYYYRIINLQLLGIIFFILGSAYSVMKFNQEILYSLIVILLIIEFIVRVTKSIISVFALNVSWYYIILYFCTLEILPTVILFSVYQELFRV